MTTIGSALAQGRARLAAAGIASAALDARLLLAHVLGETHERLVGWPERPMPMAAQTRFESMIARRARHEPVAYLIGTREFWGLQFQVSPVTLIPRPDSETVVAAALARFTDRSAPLRIIDIGTGTGCLLIALLHEMPRATGVGIDLPQVLELAAANARAIGVDARASWRPAGTLAAQARADLVVANLPYIERDEIERLAPDVADYEPLTALDGGPDGLDLFRMVSPFLPGLLGPGGRACFEVGAGQAAAVEAVLAGVPGLAPDGRDCDLAGVARVVSVRRLPG